ncbi:MAG: winged helix-turn-helix transcriptional regulator [Parcubacteria group bacterium]|nr:winged helix-turn-helix transcriptional regulator [Parcubacteria group bacterium]
MQKRNIYGERSRITKQIKKELKDKKALVQCAENFNVIGDFTRLKVCYLLCHHKGLSVGEIADVVGISISAVSHTLKKLQEAKIAESYRVHRNVYYQLKKSPFTNIIKSQFK